jgi:hypothetical protein
VDKARLIRPLQCHHGGSVVNNSRGIDSVFPPRRAGLLGFQPAAGDGLVSGAAYWRPPEASG